jgi:transcriptional regulator with GAF, ATPase, and Fis domain
LGREYRKTTTSARPRRLGWGTHFCQFYKTRDDLLEVVVRYLKAGLENNEDCVWVISKLTEQEAHDALRSALPDLERHVAQRSLEVYQEHDWYFRGGSLDLDTVRKAWTERTALALARGRAGLRVIGDTVWLVRDKWSDFDHYEEELNNSISDRRMLMLCTYSLATSTASDILHVIHTHQFTVARRRGNWDVVETAALGKTKSEIKKLNEELEQRVLERTKELKDTNEQLKGALREIDDLRQRLESENEYLRDEVQATSANSEIIGSSPAMRRVFDQIEVVAPTDAPVLILGETEVGKELVARAIHLRSARRDAPLIRVNCSAIPGELFESEFFGHVKGSFTGALKDRMGRFQIADHGTLFLDELGDLPPAMQPKLLRVLEEGDFEHVGDDQTRHADVRVIAATNRNLQRAVRKGRFREDLYYRLSVFPIEVPPLRERAEDILVLARHFLEEARKSLNRPRLRLTESQLAQLQEYDWPGNVRELRNVVERAVIGARHGSLHLDFEKHVAVAGAAKHRVVSDEPQRPLTEGEMKRRERKNIAAALSKSKGRIYGSGGAAELLGLRPTTLSARIKKLGLKKHT